MIYLQEVRVDDVNLLYKWVNDSAVRKSSFNTDPISYENHITWFNKIMAKHAVCSLFLWTSKYR